MAFYCLTQRLGLYAFLVMFCIVFFKQVGLFAIISNQLYCHNCICQTDGIICNYLMLDWEISIATWADNSELNSRGFV